MTAVVHAQYSFIHILKIDNLLFQHAGSKEDRATAQALICDTLPKMKKGLGEIRRHAVCDRAGRQFLNGFFAWCEEVIAEADELVKEEVAA